MFDGGQLPATPTNNNAVPGALGEYVSATVLVGAAVGLTTATAATIASVSLTPGDWDVWGEVWFAISVGTTDVRAALNTAAGTLPTAPAVGVSLSVFNDSSTAANPVIATGPCRILLSVTTTVYLVAQAGFAAGTAAAYGKMTARRER